MSSETNGEGGGRIEVGKFYVEGGALYGPADYMREQGDEKLARILAGEDTVFNMTSHLSPNIYTAILVAMQTDYAGWHGMKSFCRTFKIEDAASAGAQ